MAFARATKKKRRARIAIVGPSGSGKTIDALKIARQLVGPDGRIAVRDSEHESASLYCDQFVFETEEPAPTVHSPEAYIKSIRDAEAAGFDCLILDSFSHAWAGAGGILEQADKKGKKFDVWKELTPQQNKLIETMLAAKLHLIVTMRTKTEWVMEKEKKQDGREVNKPVKIGTTPVQRQDVDYEFDLVVTVDQEHSAQIDKTRCRMLDGRTFDMEHVDEIGSIFRDWLADGEDADQKKIKLKELVEAVRASGVQDANMLTWINDKLNPPKGMEIRSSGDLSLNNILALLKIIAEEKATPAQAPPAQQVA